MRRRGDGSRNIRRGGDGSSRSIRRNVGRRGLGFIFTVIILTVIVVVVVTVIVATIILVGNRAGLGSRRRGRLSNQAHGGACAHDRGCGGRSWTSPRGTVRLAVLLEGFTRFHGVATVIEELGVVFVLATNSKVTGVVVVI